MIDAKDWNKWPPAGEKWAEKAIVKDARNQAEIIHQTGTKVEWHMPSKAKSEHILEILDNNGIDEIKIVVTGK